MADQQKLVLMIQPTRLQGLIWQTVLRSQQIKVIWETPETDLVQSISQLVHAGLTLPDLLLIDIRLRDFNPYAFCRWCRENCPELTVILVNAAQKEIIPSERQWAILQGAEDLLPGFDLDNLVTSVTMGLRRALEALDGQPLDNGALISVLLSMRRQIESKRGGPPALPTSPSVSTNGRTTFTSPPANGKPVPVVSNGTNPLQPDHNGRALARQEALPPGLNSSVGEYLYEHHEERLGAERLDPVGPDSGVQPPKHPPDSPPPDDPPPTRRYRGRAY